MCDKYIFIKKTPLTLTYTRTEYMVPPRVYLAGPEIFFPREEALRLAAEKKAICSDLGLEGVFPFDLEVQYAELVGVI